MFCLLFALMLVFSSLTTAFAGSKELSNSGDLTKKNILKMVEKYNLETVPEDELPEGMIPDDRIKSLDDLEATIIEHLNMPSHVDLGIIGKDDNNLSMTRSITTPMAASSGATTVYKIVESANNLKLRLSASGKYTTNTSGTKIWTEATGSSVTEYSNKGFTRLHRVESSSVEIKQGDGTIMVQTYKVTLQHYAWVAGFWIKIHKQQMTGTAYHECK
ncbi:hypothetical protein [Paramaledivibacter caminithermalis]|jgi:hypothetical protein|uniref:Uncharacterized protein n=1 Tax=Paramaledivibacter caminithermalis (strain DSM 15212 / CIP 107654 / DViRD3) TaxID=1121301 RepID=A0A1M6NKQ4_PARC5|nr:hypothetical protein [Paramaledivibacter caminithermalis]SHJ96256.1 hypothetical protein SAMN02745912_01770 [Paramaledivibacter caminithermalis DSM 15212]